VEELRRAWHTMLLLLLHCLKNRKLSLARTAARAERAGPAAEELMQRTPRAGN